MSITFRVAVLMSIIAECLCMRVTAYGDAIDSSNAEESFFDVQENSSEIILPYCGIQSVYLAARGLGYEIDFTEFVSPKYLGSKKGSSVTELTTLCEDIGVRCRFFQYLTTSSLAYTSKPLILHITHRPGSKKIQPLGFIYRY